MPPGRAVAAGITSLSDESRVRIEAALGRPVQWTEREDLAAVVDSLDDVTELLIGLRVAVGRDILDRLPLLRYVGVYGTSTSRVDPAAQARGVTVTNVQHYCDPETAEFAVALVLGGLRGVFVDSAFTESATSATVGVIGMGQVGRLVADRMATLGATVEAIGRPHGEAAVHARLARLRACDVVSLHGPRDVCVLGATDLDALPEHAGIVDTCNGMAIDPDALRDWLGRGDGWLALDEVAARTYGTLCGAFPGRVFASARAAYRTSTAVRRLGRQFAANVEHYCAR